MIAREQMVEQSVQDFIRERLETLGYTDDKVRIRDAFPTLDERSRELDITQVAFGFSFDNGGTHIELGSNLTQRIHTIEIWVFGTTATYGRNVATVIRAILESNEYLVPLKDISDPAQPVIDQLVVPPKQGIMLARQRAADPMPWDMNVFTCTIKLEDIYFPTILVE